ncbi:MAG: hypothetical protein O2975_07350, partial [Proteobacteria bacterium]|nr:hypothetical protein [Pseudomonadota bacterium]
AVLAMLASIAPAAESADLGAALIGGTFWADARYRIEHVDQNNALRNATASTLRIRPGYESGAYRGFSVLLEAESVLAIGNDDYNSTVNGKTARSVVADPEATEINRAQLGYAGFPSTKLVYGRQRLILDNSRFVGNVGWRQNEQTYDAFTLVNASLPNTRVTAGYLWNVNRVFSDKHPAGNFKMDSPILNIHYSGWALGQLTGYAYLLDFANTPTASTSTFGLRFSGARALSGTTKLQYTVEGARQRDYKDNPARFRLDYHRLEAGLAWPALRITLGEERLAGNGTVGFQTPLATLHAMNGWADVFLTTPATGLKDRSLSIGATALGIKWLAVAHRFRADRGGARYGTEWDLQAVKTFGKDWTVGLKIAHYNARTFSVDTDKAWAWVETKF